MRYFIYVYPIFTKIILEVNINNETLISGGYQGSEGDIIVDSILKPSYVIGISDGAGGIKQRINKPYKFINNYDNEISQKE